MPSLRTHYLGSATIVAWLRALASADPALRYEDPQAQRLLPPMFKHLLRWPTAIASVLAITHRGALGYVLARTRYIDHVVRNALDDGYQQIVIIGAGFDTRLFRLPALAARNIRIVEIDRPFMLEERHQRFADILPASIVRVGTDLSHDAFQETLLGKLDPAQPTLFILEGLSLYLSDYVMENLLQCLSRFPSRSRLVMDYMDSSFLNARASIHGRIGTLAWIGLSGERFRFHATPERMRRILQRYGWHWISGSQAIDLQRQWLPRQGPASVAFNWLHLCLVESGPINR